MKKYLVALLFVAQAPLASAAVTYNTEAAFLTQLQPGYYLENFNGYTDGDPLDGNQTSWDYGPVNGYSWTASATNGLYSVTGALSVNAHADLLTIIFTGNPVTALGGIFASTDIDGAIIQQLVTIILSDSTTVSLTGSDFRGFTSAVPIVSLTIDGIDGTNPTVDNYPALSHFYVGSAIPEPTSLALLGLGGLLLAPWRRFTRG